MRCTDVVTRIKRFAAIEALLIHKGVCGVRDCIAAFAINHPATNKTRSAYLEEHLHTIEATTLRQHKGWKPVPDFVPIHLPVKEGQTFKEAAQQYLYALDIINGTDLASVTTSSALPWVAPIFVLSNGFVYIEDSRSLATPELHQFTEDEAKLAKKFPANTRLAFRMEGRRRFLISLGSWTC